MCEAVGHPVTRLVRTRIGPITDTRLRPGEWRELDPGRGRGAGAVPRSGGGRHGVEPDEVVVEVADVGDR